MLGLSRGCVVAFCKACGANAAITRLDQRWVSLGRSFTVCFPHSFQSKPVKVKVLVVKSCLTVTPWKPARLLCPWNFPAKNTRVGSYSLLQGILLTQGSNLELLHCRQILHHLSHQGSPYKRKYSIAPIVYTYSIAPVTVIYF